MFKKLSKNSIFLLKNHKKSLLTTIFCLLFVTFPTLADTYPTGTKPSSGCVFLTMCSSQSGNTVCDTVGDGTGDQYVTSVEDYSSFAFYSTRSTATAYTCTVRTNTTGYDSGGANAINPFASSLTPSNKWFTATTKMSKLFVTCSGISGGVVHVDMLACVGGY